MSDQYIVTYFNGVSTSGIYTAAYKIPNFVTIFASIFIDAWQISAVEDVYKRQHDDGHTVSLSAGDGFAQGIFLQFGITVDDDASGIRDGGFGSTTKG